MEVIFTSNRNKQKSLVVGEDSNSVWLLERTPTTGYQPG